MEVSRHKSHTNMSFFQTFRTTKEVDGEIRDENEYIASQDTIKKDKKENSRKSFNNTSINQSSKDRTSGTLLARPTSLLDKDAFFYDAGQ